MTDPLAIYAAVVGTGSLGRQVYVWRRKLRTDVRVEVRHSIERGLAAEHYDDVARLWEYQIEAAAVNVGETLEYVKSLRVETPDGETHALLDPSRGAVDLEPRSRLVGSVRVERTQLRLGDGFRAIAELASGKEVASHLQHLDGSLLERAKRFSG